VGRFIARRLYIKNVIAGMPKKKTIPYSTDAKAARIIPTNNKQAAMMAKC